MGTIQENVEGNSQSISTLQQTSESVVANVSALDRKFNEDVEAKELRDNISKALLSLQSVIGIFSSDMNKYMEDNDGAFPHDEIKEIDNENDNTLFKDSYTNAKYIQMAKSYPLYLELLEKENLVNL